MASEAAGDVLIAAGYAFLVAAWSFLIPFNGGPDESTHFFLLEYIYKFGMMPAPGVDPAEPFVGLLSGAVFRKSDIWYQGLPFLHVLGAEMFAKGFSWGFPPGEEFMAARSFNWALAGIFMFCLLRALRTVGQPPAETRAIAILFGAIPQVTFVFAYFNHDAFGLMAVTLALWAYLPLAKGTTPDRTKVMTFGAACGLVILSKPYHYPALVFFGSLLALVKWSNRQIPLISIFTRTTAAALVVSLPILLVTSLHFGDITGVSEMKRYSSMYPDLTVNSCFISCEGAIINWRLIEWWILWTYMSFFGVFGWMNLFLPNIFYNMWFVPLTALFLLLASIYVAKRFHSTAIARASAFEWGFVVLTLLMLVATTSMSLITSQIIGPQAQGRYLFVVIPFLAYCTCLFAADYLDRERLGAVPLSMLKPAGRSRVRPVLFALAAIMVTVNAYAAIIILAPATSDIDRYSKGLVEFLGLPRDSAGTWRYSAE